MTIKRPNLNYFILTMKLIWIIRQNPASQKIMPIIQKRQQTAFQIHVWRPLQQSPQRPQLVPLQRPLRVQINWRNLTITPVWIFAALKGGLWAFHPILVTWFLVAFGDKATKILCSSLFTFFTEQGKTGKPEIYSKENQATKMTKKPKTELPEFVISWALTSETLLLWLQSPQTCAKSLSWAEI